MASKQHTVYLLLGSNQQEPVGQLLLAEKKVEKFIGPVIRKSRIYQTEAWGNVPQPDFLNRVLIVSTQFNAVTVLEKILQIEQSMGRIRTSRYAPRIIDIDILFYEKEIIHIPHLDVPHPLLTERKFVLVPLNELSPQFIHPEKNESIHTLLKKCRDPLNVKRI